jgi:hypothetical protein
MKKILIIFVLLFTVKAGAQDTEPNQRQFFLNGWRYLNGNDSILNPHKFTYNFHWGSSMSLMKAFGFNVAHVNSEVYIDNIYRFLDPELDKILDSTWLILNIPRIGHHWDGYKPLYSMCIRYEPTLRIDSAKSINTLQNRHLIIFI